MPGASAAAITLPTAVTGLPVIPGVWLLTRWSLFTPAISSERPGPEQALKHGSRMVRGHFWLVCLTATLAFILEEAIIHVGAFAGYLILDSDTWGEWAGATISAALITPVAALATSVTYQRLKTHGAISREER